MNFVETVKLDDPRLDESFSLLFIYRKGDVVVSRENRALRDGSMTVSMSESFPTERQELLTQRARQCTKSSFRTRYCRSSTKRTLKKLPSDDLKTA